ncbi:MAG: hypothetical protein ACRD0D_08095 [Acidimicrobiales bacterium]
MAYRYDDGTEDVAGPRMAHYARPGHTPVFSAGTEVVEFSQSAQLARTIEVVLANLARMEAAET